MGRGIMMQAMHDDRAPATTALDGRVALVTGGARRIGAAIGRELHAAGMNVVIHHHRSSAEATRLATELNVIRPDSATIRDADLTDTARIGEVIEGAVSAFGRLDVLVNNASSFYPSELGSIDESVWDDLVGTNLKAPLFLAQAAHPWLRQTSGCIVNLADIHGERPLERHAVYCAAKAGLIMLTRALARDMGPAVRVNAISPGPILWPDRDEVDSEARAAIIASTALGRMGHPGDIARAVLFLLRDAPYVTGQNIAVDGGRSLAL
jgi:pteridine reductase